MMALFLPPDALKLNPHVWQEAANGSGPNGANLMLAVAQSFSLSPHAKKKLGLKLRATQQNNENQLARLVTT